jgi:isochorismate pyruvate lyase
MAAITAISRTCPMTNTILPPEDCTSMAQVRSGVDALDRQLVELLAVRQRYMDAAARIKPQRDQVYDAARIEDVVTKVKSHASGHGLSDAIAEPVWRLLIDRSIAHELARWDSLRSAG